MVKLVSVTQGAGELINSSAQELIAYTARVSNPGNQMNTETAPRLLKYLIKHRHWSPFEMAHVTVEITTSRAVAQQILRHRSFSFQEFSQRYAEANNFLTYPARRQDVKNKQNSIDDMDEDDRIWFQNAQTDLSTYSQQLYAQALKRGIAKEQARFLLPLNTETRLYMCGSVRSWIHYIDLRSDVSTQKEHRDIANECKRIFIEQFPAVAEALEWNKESVCV